MERLTRRTECGDAYYPECYERCYGEGASEKCNDCDYDEKICDALAGYEDTGLTPEQIMELADRDTEYFCKTSMFDHESVVCKCGNDIEKDSGFKFCPYCGHRIKLED